MNPIIISSVTGKSQVVNCLPVLVEGKWADSKEATVLLQLNLDWFRASRDGMQCV